MTNLLVCHSSLGCGGRTRTCDLQVMSLASYQLLHSAVLFLNCECKGNTLFLIMQDFPVFFVPRPEKVTISWSFCNH